MKAIVYSDKLRRVAEAEALERIRKAAPYLLAVLEALVAACEDYTESLFCVGCSGEPEEDEDGNQTDDIDHSSGCAIVEAKAAIAKAKGGH